MSKLISVDVRMLNQDNVHVGRTVNGWKITIKTLSGNINQTRTKACKSVFTDKQANLLTVLKIENPHCAMKKFISGNLKEVVSRIPSIS